jgi:hypothetical protein
MARMKYASRPGGDLGNFALCAIATLPLAIKRRQSGAFPITPSSVVHPALRTLAERHPEWSMAERNILRRIDYQDQTLDLDGRSFPLRDAFLPTIDPVIALLRQLIEANRMGQLQEKPLA